MMVVPPKATHFRPKIKKATTIMSLEAKNGAANKAS